MGRAWAGIEGREHVASEVDLFDFIFIIFSFSAAHVRGGFFFSSSPGDPTLGCGLAMQEDGPG